MPPPRMPPRSSPEQVLARSPASPPTSTPASEPAANQMSTDPVLLHLPVLLSFPPLSHPCQSLSFCQQETSRGCPRPCPYGAGHPKTSCRLASAPPCRHRLSGRSSAAMGSNVASHLRIRPLGNDQRRILVVAPAGPPPCPVCPLLSLQTSPASSTTTSSSASSRRTRRARSASFARQRPC